MTGERRRVLAIDIDEVLGHFVLKLCHFHNEKFGTVLTPEDFKSYYFHEVWGGTRASADEKMRDFFESPHFLDGIPVVPGAERVLRKHASNFELHIVTSRQDILREHTREWVEAHFPGVFDGRLHFGNHFGSGAQRSKPELCRSIQADLIIDDNMRYATQCAEAGIPAYLFGDYAWNRTGEPLPKNVRRTVSWDQVDAELEAFLLDGGSGCKEQSDQTAAAVVEQGGGGAAAQQNNGTGTAVSNRKASQQPAADVASALREEPLTCAA